MKRRARDVRAVLERDTNSGTLPTSNFASVVPKYRLDIPPTNVGRRRLREDRGESISRFRHIGNDIIL